MNMLLRRIIISPFNKNYVQFSSLQESEGSVLWIKQILVFLGSLICDIPNLKEPKELNCSNGQINFIELK